MLPVIFCMRMKNFPAGFNGWDCYLGVEISGSFVFYLSCLKMILNNKKFRNLTWEELQYLHGS